jgi:hypothetical protein
MSEKWFIATGSTFAPKKFFSRKTQGFTEITPNEDCAYTQRGAQRLHSCGEPFKIWARMVENNDDLTLWAVSEETLKYKAIL